MKKKLAAITTSLFLFCTVTLAQAALTTIGTATYQGSDYKLIWDDDNNGNSVIWLDYSYGTATWSHLNNWAGQLGPLLTYNIDPDYTVDWIDSWWHLPDTVDGPYENGYDGTTTGGFNITTSEMGHLFYTELGNLGLYDTNGDFVEYGTYGLINTGDFDNLIAHYYWSSDTEFDDPSYPERAWLFRMGFGDQYCTYKYNSSGYGLAVRSGNVSAVPIPGAVYLFASGLIGIVGIRRIKFRK